MQRRFCLFDLPCLSTDRLRRRWRGGQTDRPLVTFEEIQGRLIVAAADGVAGGLGLRPGMPLADARAIEPDLAALPAEPAADARVLNRLATLLGVFSPLVSTRGSHGLILDIAGCAHLFGGEAALLAAASERLAASGFRSCGAIAGNPVAAWALARSGGGYAPPRCAAGPSDPAASVVVAGAEREVLAPLPIDGLDLPPAMVEALCHLGLRRIGDLLAQPRATLASRFDTLLLDRLDQALGRQGEPISPHPPPRMLELTVGFAEPISRTEDVLAALDRLLLRLCDRLAEEGLGARHLVLSCARVDGAVVTRGVGTHRAGRDAAGLARLFAPKLEDLDAGFGIERLVLAATRAQPLSPDQGVLVKAGTPASLDVGPGRPPAAVVDLIDRLDNRLGSGTVYRTVPVQSYLPERAVAASDPLSGEVASTLRSGAAGAAMAAIWPDLGRRPVRLLSRPLPIEVMAPVPDDPPLQFIWAGARHRVLRAAGPERIAPEWWRRDGGRRPRDYYRVEVADGRRFWLYRDGLYAPDRSPRWFLHGFFA